MRLLPAAIAASSNDCILLAGMLPHVPLQGERKRDWLRFRLSMGRLDVPKSLHRLAWVLPARWIFSYDNVSGSHCPLPGEHYSSMGGIHPSTLCWWGGVRFYFLQPQVWRIVYGQFKFMCWLLSITLFSEDCTTTPLDVRDNRRRARFSHPVLLLLAWYRKAASVVTLGLEACYWRNHQVKIKEIKAGL